MDNYTLSQIIVCPACKNSLEKTTEGFKCTNDACNGNYPVYNKIPILINPSNDLFEQKDFESEGDIFFKTYNSGLTRFLKKIQPDITYNDVSEKNYLEISELLKFSIKQFLCKLFF